MDKCVWEEASEGRVYPSVLDRSERLHIVLCRSIIPPQVDKWVVIHQVIHIFGTFLRH